MIVVLASACQKKAKIKTRRIVSKYLEQIGPKTWMGYISQENLEAMKSELASHRSVHSAIVCHRVVNRRRTEVIWRIGKMAQFDDNGLYSFSQTGEERRFEPNHSFMLDVMAPLVRLAGLFHDLGKGTVGFQHKLAEAIKDPFSMRPDPIRHELVSYLMLLSLDTDQGLLTLVDSQDPAADLKAYFTGPAQARLYTTCDEVAPKLDTLVDLKRDQSLFTSHYIKPITGKRLQPNPLLATLLWLVLTHHKSPAIEMLRPNGKEVTLNLTQYLNRSDEPREDVRDFFTLSDQLQPWDRSEWCQAVKETLSELRSALEIYQAVRPETPNLFGAYPFKTPWVNLMTLAARPALVYADYKESMESEISAPTGFVYANTRQPEEGAAFQWADDLPKHLLRVGKSAGRIFTALHSFYRHPEKNLTHLTPEEVPTALLKTNAKQVPDRYKWQNEVLTAVKQFAKEQPDALKQPMFGVLISRTGSGKTRVSPGIMCALSDRVRFTLALGRRTLTLQSFRAYQEALVGFNAADMAILIGQTLPFDRETRPGAIIGSDAADLEAELTVVRNGTRASFEGIFHKMKEVNLIESPVSVMTVDHLVKTTYMGRSTDLKLLFHVQHSDLILDEIDDYSEQDALVISKLIYLYGFFGRKVLIASATLPQIQLEAMRYAFLEGVKMREQLYGLNLSVTHVIANDVAPFCEIRALPTADTGFLDTYQGFIQQVCETLKRENHKHRLRTVAMPASAEDLHPYLLRACQAFHQQNHSEWEGLKLSAGFVRFNHVEQAQRFAAYLNQQSSSDTCVRVVCYHARMLMMDRHTVESSLDSLLNRKRSAGLFPDPLWNHPLVTPAVEAARNAGVSHLIIIVSTTSIQETGRDHDYDWCILEPQSSRSLVQSAGRVGRHRDLVLMAGQYNIGILAHPIKAFQDANRSLVYGFPGIETSQLSGKTDRVSNLEELTAKAPFLLTNTPGKRIRDYLELCGIQCDTVPSSGLERLVQAEAILDRYFWETGIDASPCLLPPESYPQHPVEALTNALIASQFKNPFGSNWKGAPPSQMDKRILFRTLNSFTERSDIRLSNEHGVLNRFRDSSGQTYSLQAQVGRQAHYQTEWTATSGRNKPVPLLVTAATGSVSNALITQFGETTGARLDKMLNEHQFRRDEVNILLSLGVQAYNDEQLNSLSYHPFYGLFK